MKLDRTEQQRAALSDASAAHNLGFFQQVRIRINDHRHDSTRSAHTRLVNACQALPAELF